jgi:N-ethylmaleimide reductase
MPESRAAAISVPDRHQRRPGAGAPDLFAAARVGSWALPNRIVMAPMTRSRASVDGIPSAHAPLYYGQRAAAGLIIAEAAAVSAQGLGYPYACGLYSEAQAAGWRSVSSAVHARGGRILLQLWHAGRISHPLTQPGGADPVGPSAIAARTSVYTVTGKLPAAVPRALTLMEIRGVVEQFAAAARLARQAGFDGVDLHAANGYLIDQFLRDGANQRTDRYGGSAVNRARLLLEIVEAVLEVWPAEAVGVRLSPLEPGNDMTDSDPARLFRHVVEALDPVGLGYLHVVEPGPGHPRATPGGRELLGALRERFGGALIVDGGLDRASAEAAMSAAGADLAAFATPFIANPDLVARLIHGWPLEGPAPETIYGGDARGYVDYPYYRLRGDGGA